VFSGSTSGTTGAPLNLYQDMHAIKSGKTPSSGGSSLGGSAPGRPAGVDAGDMIVPATQENRPYWR